MYLVLALTGLAFLLSLLLTPLVRDVFLRFNILDYPDHTRKIHERPVPRVGGLALALSYAGAFALILLLPFAFRPNLLATLGTLIGLLPATALIFTTGLLDDLFNLGVRQKLAGQIVAAGLAWWGGVHIDSISGHPIELWLGLPLTLIWIVGCSNAFNLIDGVDGLAAGVGLFAALTMSVAAFTAGRLDLALVTLPLVGCLFGFLRYNFNPASVFLGDSGSLLIGFLLGCYGVLWGEKSATLVGLTAPLMAMSIPLLDVGLSVTRRFLRGKPIFGADRGHIHHMLLDQGLTPRRVALLMYAVCGLAGILSLVQGALQNQFGGLIIVLFGFGAWMGIQHLGYIEFGVARDLVFKRTFHKMIDAQTRLTQLERAIASASTLERCWEVILAASQEFGFHGVRLNIQGRVLESGAPPNGNGHWQLRISLPHHQYINFHRDLHKEMSPLIIGGFVTTVEGALNNKLDMLEVEVLGAMERMPAAVEAKASIAAAG